MATSTERIDALESQLGQVVELLKASVNAKPATPAATEAPEAKVKRGVKRNLDPVVVTINENLAFQAAPQPYMLANSGKYSARVQPVVNGKSQNSLTREMLAAMVENATAIGKAIDQCNRQAKLGKYANA